MSRPIRKEKPEPKLISRPIPLEDVELIEKVRNGDTDAFGGLIKKYQDRLFNAIWRFCGSADDAQDIVQEAFLKSYQGLAGFRLEAGFYTWIFRIAMNLALSHRRRERQNPSVSLTSQSLELSQGARLLSDRRSNGESDDAKERGGSGMQPRLVAALNELDDQHRAVVVLRDIESFDYQEIGEILEIPVGTVKSRLHRARMALRMAITPWLAAEKR